MKNLFPRLSRIALEDWLEYHPYDKEVSSDHYYVELCNDIQHEILHIDINDNLVGADYKYLSCMLTSYFEDIVSQTGIWTSFIDQHHQLYGKYLPFYDVAGYEHGEVNLADIQFLIWHFCSHLSIESHFIDPYSLENTEIAKIVYTLLDEVAGQAPRNEELKTSLILAADANIYHIKALMDYCFFGCYLNHYYMMTLLEEAILKVKNQKGVNHKNIDPLIDDRRTDLLFNHVSPVLAQRPNQTLAHWAGKSHPLYEKLKAITKRKEGLFLYEGTTATYLHMKHIASGVLVEVNTSNSPKWEFPLVADETIVRIGLVQWDDEWWSVGPVFQMDDSKKLEITEKEKCLFAPVESQLGVVRRQEECFRELNDNKPIVFYEEKREVFTFIDEVWDSYHLKYGMDSMDRKMFDVHDVTFEVDDDLDNAVVFFNPHAGMEFYADVAQCIRTVDNPYFEEDSETNIEDLMLDERISSDFISYLIQNQMVEIEPLTGVGGFHYVWANCDFLLRYWKRERYISEPKLFIE